jgi:hypothetical protein
MKLYSTINTLSKEHFNSILNFFFSTCESVNIYFPNECSEEVLNFKNQFLKSIALLGIEEDELSVLEPKEGFMMLIASLNEEVCQLLLKMEPSYALSFGLIAKEEVVFYVGDQGEIVIETKDDILAENELFKGFRMI